MPSFGRLGKHNNRSQHGLEQQPQHPETLGPSGAASLGSSVADPATATGGPSSVHSASASTAASLASVSAGGASASQQQQQQHRSSSDTNSIPSVSIAAAAPSASLSSRDEIEAAQKQLLHQQQQQQQQFVAGPSKLQKQPPPQKLQQQQHHHQQQQQPAPPPHLFNAPPPSSNPPSASGSLHHHHQQQHQHHPGGSLDDFDVRQILPAAESHDTLVNRSQSQRFAPLASSASSPHSLPPPSAGHPHQQQQQQQHLHPQQQQLYGIGIATSSADDLAAQYPVAGHNQVQSLQQLQQQQQQQQQQYLNAAPPPQQQQQQQAYPKRTTRGLQIIKGIFGSGRSSSSLGHHPPDEHYTHDSLHDNNNNAGGNLYRRPSTSKRDSRAPNPIRQVSNSSDVDPSAYDEAPTFRPSPQLLQGQLPGLVTNADQYEGSGHEVQSPIAFNNNNQDPYLSNNNSQQDILRPPTLRHTNPETDSQLSYESPVTDPENRQPGQVNAYSPDKSIAMPSGPATAGRRTQDAEKALRGAQVDPPPGPPPGYRAGTAGINPTSPQPPAVGPPSGQASFKGERGAQFEGAAVEQGRDSPAPAAERDGESEKQFKELLTKYKHVKRLYFDGKNQIEALNGQVETLQNAVANQRMSQSRTALDDSEYVTRFTRLDGAIKDLSFNIRKDWRCLPKWLDSYVSADALKTAKQEMTAVGRAVISRWLVEEIFNKCFHPGLEMSLSMQLKEIELSIRGNAHTMHSREEFDALTTKIVNWRMATLDGLQKKLDVTTTAENRALFTSKAVTNLTACLHQYLSVPPPAGIEGSASTIIEIAVALVANLPLESRDVAIMYPLPGEMVRPHLMEVDKNALPTLDGQPRPESDDDDDDDEEKSRALSKDSKVRFAGFMAVEVRGRQVLMKAPVWIL